ncbi:UNVERIFIED_CONTAM: hypothetical protein GTU68_038990, partial [Idotea baltica]|nr:hypothetical protein [Idotea baltica]
VFGACRTCSANFQALFQHESVILVGTFRTQRIAIMEVTPRRSGWSTIPIRPTFETCLSSFFRCTIQRPPTARETTEVCRTDPPFTTRVMSRSRLHRRQSKMSMHPGGGLGK